MITKKSTNSLIQPTRNLRSIIDYVILKRTGKIRVNDVRVLRGGMCDSDHHLVTAKVFFPPTNQKQQINKGYEEENTQEVKYNLESLMHDSVRYRYQKTLDEKLIEEQSHPLQERYQHIIDRIYEAAGEALGERK
ncbi:hypothetical protein HHI36_023666 [Cryptolaemus montrouzieri]|uniref:Uncharacterized protein n=1 Tax=Cryptolaemus montrouzieri TaxID=559131 RepID=A0ABD2PHT4_9CUCU